MDTLELLGFELQMQFQLAVLDTILKLSEILRAS